jgi:hypothetical protein
MGAFFFGDFLLGEQKKVSYPEPRMENKKPQGGERHNIY